ncbi:4'-phosphopantetheinyl transferase superfamily protein [Blastococcus sp. TF02-09]|uniref:4'-phosphopantetheinyl transferase superfamily protein n=1 Tax=Blastococcus sp. TF02-09 TaxID=2250576 RepID=UPI001314F5ED|nr:4'-phosphopantetheinyl transferase superfamily protein [Blastococcus sp. TF02-9]
MAAAVGWDPVGVDVETARSGDALDAALLHLTLTEREMLQVRSSPEPRATFLRHWTLKECLVKVGAATLDGLSRLEIDLSTAHRTAEGRTWTTYRNLHLLEWCDPGLGAVIGAAGAAPPVVDTFPVTSSQAETGTESRWGWTAVRAGRLVTAGGRR